MADTLTQEIRFDTNINAVLRDFDKFLSSFTRLSTGADKSTGRVKTALSGVSSAAPKAGFLNGAIRDLERLGGTSKSIDGLSSSFDRLKGAAAGLGIALGIKELADTADEYTNIQNRLRLVTDGTQNLTGVTEALFAVSNRTRSSFEATTDLYGSFARSSKELGLSQKDLIGITETINQAIKVSGTDAQTAANGIRQLAQGIASGTLRGDELNSVLENMPRLATAIAAGMGITTGQLRKLGGEGKITAKAITDALKKEAPQIAAEFTKLTPTIGDSLTTVKNNFTKFLGDFDKATGVSTAVAKALTAVGENMDVVAASAGALGVAMLVAFGPQIGAAIASATAGLVSFTVALASNPFGLLAIGVAAAGVALVAFGDDIKVTEDGAVSLKDAVGGAFGVIGDYIKTAADFLKGAWQSAMGDASAATSGFQATVGKVMAAIANFVKTYVTTIIDNWVFAVKAIVTVWNGLVPAIKDIAISAVNNLVKTFEGGVNKVIGLLNKVPGINLAPVQMMGLQNDSIGKAAALVRGLTKDWNDSRGATERAAKAFGAAAIARARQNQAAAKKNEGTVSDKAGPATLTAPDGKKKKTSGKSDAMRAWEEELKRMLASEAFYFRDSTKAELAFWESKKKLVKAGSVDETTIIDNIGKLKKKLAQDDLRAQLDNLESQQRAARDNAAEQLRIENEKAELIRKTYGEDSEQFRRALADKEEAARDFAERERNRARDIADFKARMLQADQQLAAELTSQKNADAIRQIEQDASAGRITDQQKRDRIKQIHLDELNQERTHQEALYQIRLKALEDELRLMATGTEAARKVQQDIEELKADRARNQQRTDSQEASIIKNADLDNADAMIQKTQQLSGLLTQLWDDPTAAMKSFFSSFLSSLLQSIAQATILKNTMAQASGGGIGGILKTAIGAAFGGARAGGGSVSGSSFYLVGEKGPELFAPGRSGTIIPNHALGGSNGGTSISMGDFVNHITVQGGGGDPQKIGLAVVAQQQKQIDNAISLALARRGIR